MNATGETLAPSPHPMAMFQVICLNKNGDAVQVFRQEADSIESAKAHVRTRFAFQGAPNGATTFRVVPLDR